MGMRAALAAVALLAGAVPAGAVPLAGRYDAFVEAASACAAATGGGEVDRTILAAAGWTDLRTGEIDHLPVSMSFSERNPFPLRTSHSEFLAPEGCWFVAEFEEGGDFDEVRRRLEARFGRAPDSIDADDMRGTRWVSERNVVELWMLPASELCSECPQMFLDVQAPAPDEAAERP